MTEVRTPSRIAFPVLADATTERRTEQAEARGHAAGYAAGTRTAHAEADALRARLQAEHDDRMTVLAQVTAARVAALDTAVAALTARTAPVLEDAQDAVVAAAMELAEAVVGYEIRSSRPDGGEARAGSGARATVDRALASVDRDLAIAVRLAPADAAALSGVELPVRVVADASLAVGDAVVDLPNGSLDARIGTALDRARSALGLAAGGTVG